MSYGFFRGRYKRPIYHKKPSVDNVVRDDDGSLKLKTRLTDLVVKCRTNASDEKFVSSIANWFCDKGYLTGPQFSNFERIEKKYNGAVQDTAWLTDYGPVQQHQFAIAIGYYRGLGSYFSQLIATVDGNPEYKPDRVTFNRLVNNKFVQRVIREHDAPAKFKVGDLVAVLPSRQNFVPGLKHAYTLECIRGINNSGYCTLTMNQLVLDYPENLWMITKVNPAGPFSGHPGSKLYIVRPMMQVSQGFRQLHQKPIAVEECNLRIVQ